MQSWAFSRLKNLPKCFYCRGSAPNRAGRGYTCSRLGRKRAEYRIPLVQFQQFFPAIKWWKILLSETLSRLKNRQTKKLLWLGLCPKPHWESLPIVLVGWGEKPLFLRLSKKGKGRYSSSWEPSLRATGRHLPYGITQCYLPPDTSECALPNPNHAGWYSIYLPRGMEGWVDLVDLIAPRPGVEPATFRSRVQRRTAAPPTPYIIHEPSDSPPVEP